LAGECTIDKMKAYTDDQPDFSFHLLDFGLVQGLGVGKVLIRANVPGADLVNKTIDIVYYLYLFCKDSYQHVLTLFEVLDSTNPMDFAKKQLGMSFRYKNVLRYRFKFKERFNASLTSNFNKNLISMNVTKTREIADEQLISKVEEALDKISDAAIDSMEDGVESRLMIVIANSILRAWFIKIVDID